MHVLVVVSYTGGTWTPNRFAERIRSVRWGRRTATLGITTGADVPRKGCQVCHSRRHGDEGVQAEARRVYVASCPDPCVSAAGVRPVRTLPAALGLAVVIQAVKGIVEYFWFQ